MRERPILFSAPMVRAILDGRKTQTRRIVQSPARTMQREGMRVIQYRPPGDPWYRDHVWSMRNRGGVWGDYTDEEFRALCPYGVPGDRLWVRETFWAKHDTDSDGYRTIDCGPCLHVGAELHPGIQYVATPENPECPTEPGDWWEEPPDGWDGKSDYVGQGHQAWIPWTEPFSKHPSIHMPRWASRLTLEITEVRVERLQGISGDDILAEGVGHPIGTELRYGHVTEAWNRARFRSLWESINGAGAWDANPWVWVVGFRRVG